VTRYVIGIALGIAVAGPIILYFGGANPAEQFVAWGKQAYASYQAKDVAAAKEEQWNKVYKPHPACVTGKTAVDDLTCRSELERQRTAFEASWNAAIARGWKPGTPK
jgi:hypothetical protein